MTAALDKRGERLQVHERVRVTYPDRGSRTSDRFGPEVQVSRRRRFVAIRGCVEIKFRGPRPRHRRDLFPHRLDVTVEDLAALATRSGGAGTVCVAPATGDDAPVAAAAALDDSLCSGIVVAVPAAPAVSALVGRAPEASPWFVRRRGVIIDVPAGAVAGSRAIVSLPDDGSARQATVTIAFPPGLSTGQELTVALEV